MERWHLWVSVVAIAVFAFLLSRDALARLAWQRYANAPLALVLVRQDASLAMQLGNYYFGPASAKATAGKGHAYNLERAERAYRKALHVQPDILWGHYQLARIHFVKGDYAQALEEINRELAANPENLRSLYVRGLIYGYRNLPGDLIRAEADFQRFTLWAPKEWGGYNDLAWILSRQGKYQAAQAAIVTARGEVPGAERNPWLWNSLGVAQLNLNEYAAAGASFTTAKALAEALTTADWRQAYPGNDPTQAESGRAAFVAAITENLRRSSAVDKLP